MPQTTFKNFHVPLTKDVYNQLREVAQRSQQPATVLAREAIKQWLAQKQRELLHQQIVAYAIEQAGTSMDLDEVLEQATTEFLAQEGKTL